MRDYEAGARTGGLARIPDEFAVDEDSFDADGEFLRLGESGTVENHGGIEQNQVGVGTFAKSAAIFPAEALRGERSHFANGFG